MTGSETSDLIPSLIFIDKEGRWHYEGVEMLRRDFIRLFYENMEMDHLGRYIINWGGKRCYVEVEDTAFVVRNMAYQDATDGRHAQVILCLSDDSQEDLAPETLYVGKDNILYCRVKSSTFPARFSRAAYYSLAAYIEEEENELYLPINGKRHKIVVPV